MRFSRTVSMKLRYCSASASTEICCQIDLLPPRQIEQQVERPLIAADIDIHDLVVVGRRGFLEPIGRGISH